MAVGDSCVFQVRANRLLAKFPIERAADFSNRLFEAWGLGAKDRNNGVLLAVFLADRKVRIEVGYGLEARLTD